MDKSSRSCFRYNGVLQPDPLRNAQGECELHRNAAPGQYAFSCIGRMADFEREIWENTVNSLGGDAFWALFGSDSLNESVNEKY